MALMMVEQEVKVSLVSKLRTRIAEGAQIMEFPVEDMPNWFAAKLEAGLDIRNVFVSNGVAAVAVLADGNVRVGRIA